MKEITAARPFRGIGDTPPQAFGSATFSDVQWQVGEPAKRAIFYDVILLETYSTAEIVSVQAGFERERTPLFKDVVRTQIYEGAFDRIQAKPMA